MIATDDDRRVREAHEWERTWPERLDKALADYTAKQRRLDATRAERMEIMQWCRRQWGGNYRGAYDAYVRIRDRYIQH